MSDLFDRPAYKSDLERVLNEVIYAVDHSETTYLRELLGDLMHERKERLPKLPPEQEL